MPALDIPPMLADRGIPWSLAGWCVESKLDGWRVRSSSTRRACGS